MIHLQVHEAAALSIVEQADYFKERAGTELALKWEAAVDEAILSLLRWPEIGAHCRLHSRSLAGIRWTGVPGFPKHMIFYRFSESEETVFVIQVLHGARDLDAIFRNEKDSK